MRQSLKPLSLMSMTTALALWFFGALSAAAHADLPNLFTPAASKATTAQFGPETVRYRHVNVDLRLLKEALPRQRMTLDFTGDRPYTGVVEEVAARSSRGATMRGRLEGVDGSSFLIARHENAVAGVFRVSGSRRLYQLRSGGNGIHLIEQIDPSRYPPEACFISVPQGGQAMAPAPPAETDAAESVPSAADAGLDSTCTEPPTVLDVMLVYTPEARQAMGGTHEAAIAQCQLAVAVGNQAYTNSLINPRLRLVHCTEVNHTEDNNPDGLAYMEAELGWLSSPILASQVHADRDTYGADFVSMLISRGTGYGWCGGGVTHAFSVVKWDRAVNTWSLVHEMGHNQGCDHNREDAGDGCHAMSYSYGHHFFGNSGTEWGTVMSYPGTRVAHFSNPNVSYDGQPTGVPIGEAGEAYNVRQINLAAPAHEDYRLTRYDIWLDFNRFCAFGVTCDGRFLTPYGTLADAVAAVPVGQTPSELPNLWIKSSTSDETMTIDKPMTIRACNGDVTIGVAQ